MKQFFAWMLSVVMVISLMPNNMIVTKAAETTGISLAEVIATDDGSIPTLEAGSVETITSDTTKTTVVMPDVWDEETGEYGPGDEEIVVYRLKVPGNSSVALKSKYNGSENTEYSKYTYVQVFSADAKVTESTASDFEDVTNLCYTEGYCSISNNSSEEAVYAVCVKCGMDTELSVESFVDYTTATATTVDSIAFTGDRVCYEYTDVDWNTNSIVKIAKYGYLNSVTIPEGKVYKLTATYSGDEAIQSEYTMNIFEEYYPIDDMQIALSRIAGLPTDGSVAYLYGGKTYYLTTDDGKNLDWSLIEFTAEEVPNISTLKDSNATPITGNGKVDGTTTDTEYIYSTNPPSKGALFCVSLAPNTGYDISSDTSFYVYIEENLGIEAMYSGYNDVSLFNGNNDPVNYYIWVPESYDENGNSLPITLTVDSVNLVANSTSTVIEDEQLGSALNPPVGSTTCVYLDSWVDGETGEEITNSTTVTGTIYSVEVPANSKYIAKLQYVGTEYDEFGSVAANCNIVDSNSKWMSSTSVSNYYDSMNDSYSNVSSVSIDNSNNSATMTVYIVVAGNYSQGDIQLTVGSYPNIANLVKDATDITDKSTYDVTVSKEQYEYISGEDGFVSEGYGELVKLVLEPGENRYYRIPSDSMELYELDGEQLNRINGLYGGCRSIYNESTDTPKTYYIWLYYYNSDAEGGQIERLDDSMSVANNTTKNLSVDGSANKINAVDDTALYYKYEPIGNGPDAGCGEVTGDMYKVQVPAGERYVMKVEYVGDDIYENDPTEFLTTWFFDENSKYVYEYGINNCKSESQGMDSTSFTYTLDNRFGESPATYYVVFSTENDKQFQYSIFEYPNINSLIVSAEDITDISSYTGDYTEYSYEFVWGNNGSTGDCRGGLTKFTVNSGERRYYSLINAEQGVLYKLIDGELVYQSSHYGAFNVNNTTNEDEEYYVWAYTYMDSYDTYTISQTQNINTLKDSAVEITGAGSYTGEVSGDSYLTNNSGASSVGALFKITLEPGQKYMIEGKDMYGNSYTGYQYTEGGLGKVIYHIHWGSPYVISNFNDTTTTYYIWHSAFNTDEYGQYPDITIQVSEVSDIKEAEATELPTDGTQTVVTPNLVNLAIKSQTMNYDTGEMYFISNAEQGTLYYVDIPANSNYNLVFDYIGEKSTGWYDMVNSYGDRAISNICKVYEGENQDGIMSFRELQVSKYADMPNYNTNSTGRFSDTYAISNDSDNVKRYYILVQNDRDNSQVALTVKEPDSINVLVENALDISTYNSYDVSFSSEMYRCPTADGGETLTRGALAKVTLQPNQVIELCMNGNTTANVYELVEGKLEYQDTLLFYSNILANESSVAETYYLWMNCAYTEIGYSYVTTSACNAKYLRNLEDSAKVLTGGKNTLSGANSVDVLTKTMVYLDIENNIYKEIYMTDNAAVYKFDVPAKSTATFTLDYNDTGYTSGPKIYRSFEETDGFMSLFYDADNGSGIKEYSVSNVSDTIQTVCVCLPAYYSDCTINITVDSFKDKFLIYTWNNEISSRIIGVLEAHPEYMDKVYCINFDISGTGDEYINEIKEILAASDESSSIVVMDIDIIGKLKSESGFIGLDKVGFDTATYDKEAYDYTVELGTYNDTLKFATYEAHPGSFIYNKTIAKEVLGTDDPVEVQKLIGDPEKFLAVAKQMKAEGYYMTSGEDIIANLGRYTFNEDEAKKLSASLTAGGYTTGNTSWSVGWTEDMMSGDVFGFFGSPWFVYWSFMYSDIPVGLCEGPVYYPWGGCFLGIASDGDNANDAMAAEFLNLLCCDDEVMYTYSSSYVNDINGDIVFPNNQVAVERLIADGYGMASDIEEHVTLSNNPLPVWHNAAKRIGKGEWESKCTDRKYVIKVDANKQINLDPTTKTGKDLADAGFVYTNFTKIADTDGNATFDSITGVLTVDNLDKVVRYIYTENGVSRELQFIACEEKETAVKVQEDIVVDEEKGETTTTFIEVDAVNGEIVGQVDEVEVETQDDTTTIVVTENKDAEGEVVKDASITVSQETISEDTINQSIDVAETKNDSYAQAAEENEAIEEKVEIKEIKAEFKDDTANTEVSKELINKLQDKDMSLEISKKNDKDEVEYSWHFDRNSMKHADKEEIIPVNTKVTIHTDDDLTGYDEDKREKINELTGNNGSQGENDTSVVAFDHDGKLPGKTTVTVNVGNKYGKGTYVYYYHYDDVTDRDNPKLVPKGRGKVDKDGYLPVRIDHCSDYVLTTTQPTQATSATLSTAEGELDDIYDMETGEELKLECEVTPADAMQDVTYSSSDTKVLTVDSYGNVKAVSAGEATITATVNDGSEVKVSVTITVENPTVHVAEITLNKITAKLEAGDTVSLTATVKPDNATNKEAIWSSDNEDVAIVDNGKVTAVAEGTANITVTATDGSGIAASCKVTVTKKVVYVTEVTISETSVSLEAGQSTKLSATVAPEDASNKSVTWSSNDKTVASVDSEGNVTTYKAGTVTITATAADGSGKSASCKLTVTPKVVMVSEITVDKTSMDLKEGDSSTITATVAPSTATNKELKWTSSDTSVATVDANGKVTAIKAGKAIITATAKDGSGVEAECKVTVAKKVIYATEVTISKTVLSIKEGETAALNAKVAPDNATNKSVNWSSSDKSVATVDASGNITALKAGTVTITATAADGSGKSASCKVTVKPAVVTVSKITIDSASVSLEEGATATIKAIVTPSNATNATLTWTSSDPSVVSVDASGKVTALKEGTATITIAANDGSGKKAECKITVAKKVVYATDVTISNTSLSLEEGETAALTVTVAPDNATNKSVNWSSNDTSVATVDADGNVTALKPGVAVITAAAADGSGKTATCKLTVTEEVVETVDVLYHTHIQNYGDSQGTKKNGEMAGTKGESKRLESIWVEIDGNENLGIQYTTHCQSYGWMPWSADGEVNGTSGESKRLEAIMIQLTGEDADKYDVYYRVHAQNYGWLGWAKNGEPSGTSGESKRLEGIQIVVVPRGESFDKNMEGYESVMEDPYKSSGGSSPILGQESTDADNPVVAGADEPFVMYKTHVQTYGWQQWVINGAMSGTSHESKRLEGINIKVSNMPYDGDIVYTTHVQTYGWQGELEDQSTWKKNGEMSGTNGESKRLEAICINLTGEMAEHYDVYYRVHAQNVGWLGWAKNGEQSGTAGYSRRLEGIQIILVPKGEAAPTINYGGITSDTVEAFIEKN